jgi:predicted amidohydrolase
VTFKVATAAWEVRAPQTLDAWQDDLTSRLADAAALGAHLAVVPEYAALELAALVPQGDVGAQLEALQQFLPGYVATYAELARRLDMYVLAGSFPERDDDGRLRNRARLFGPAGGAGSRTKRVMTKFEQRWSVAPGDEEAVFATDLGIIGVAVCYDAEFPLLVRRQAEAGAKVILVPSCTDAIAGYWRVRIAAQARALENQCYVVHAPTVGVAAWCPAIDDNHGAAGIYGPPDLGFPADGVVAIGELDRAGWTVAELDLDLVDGARVRGAVAGHDDWNRSRHLAGEIDLVTVS